MNRVFLKYLLKWFICVASIIGLYLIFGNVGVLFSLALCYITIKYL